MASATRIQITSKSLQGAFIAGKQPNEACLATVNKLLQENLDKHHAIFNREEGFHSHIVHHQLALLGLGACSTELEAAFQHKLSDQRPIGKINEQVLSNLRDPTKFQQELGNVDKYRELLVFYQEAIDKRGYEQVIKEELLADNDRANNLLGRMYAGLLHPIIHLGYGVEFEQPAIIAEALAQAALHPDWIAEHLQSAESLAIMKGQPDKSLFTILREVQSDSSLRESVKYEDGNKIRDGIFKRAPHAMLHFLSQIKFRPTDLTIRTSEMINLTAYIAAAAQRANKEVRYDFFLIHALNCSVFFSSVLKQDWLSTEQKIRLLEYKARMDIIMYVSQGMPDLRIEDVHSYQPKKQSESSWDNLFNRINQHMDDGHGSKLIRALVNGQKACNISNQDDVEGSTSKTESSDHPSEFGNLTSHFMFRDGDWLRAANMAVDSVEDIVDGQTDPPRWVRNAGFERAWDQCRPRAQL